MGNCDSPPHGSLLCFTFETVRILSIIWHLVSFRCCCSKIWSLAVPFVLPTEYVPVLDVFEQKCDVLA